MKIINKKIFLIFLLIVNYAQAMQRIKEVDIWSDERMHDFMQEFGSESFTQEYKKIMNSSYGARKTILKKSEEKDKENGHQLFSGAIIVTMLPFELQKKILQEVDPVFTDQETTELFLTDRSLKDALGWHARVCKKNLFTLVHHHTGWGQNWLKKSTPLTKKQLLELSLDEAFWLKTALISDEYIYCKYESRSSVLVDKNRLIALNKLMQREYLIVQDNARVFVTVKPKIDLFFKIGTRIILPLLVHFCIRSYLSNSIIELIEPKINKELALDSTVLLHFVPSMLNPFIFGLLPKLFLPKLCSYIFFNDNISYFAMSNFLMFISAIVTSMVRDTDMMFFDFCDFFQWVSSFMFYSWNEGGQAISIPIREIPNYLNNRWITIK